MDCLDEYFSARRAEAPVGENYFVCGAAGSWFRFPGTEKTGVWGCGWEMYHLHNADWRNGLVEVYADDGQWHKAVGYPTTNTYSVNAKWE